MLKVHSCFKIQFKMKLLYASQQCFLEIGKMSGYSATLRGITGTAILRCFARKNEPAEDWSAMPTRSIEPNAGLLTRLVR